MRADKTYSSPFSLPARTFQQFVRRWCWLLLGLVTTAAAGQGWRPGFHCPGLNAYVNAVVALPNGDLIAGGGFTNAGGHPAADYVARWDGRTWQGLGGGLPGISNVTALAAAPNGTLYVAGTRLDSSGVYGIVACWNGHRWQQLGPATRSSWATTLAVAPNGDVLANDLTTTCGVRRWHGQAWQPLAPNSQAASPGLLQSSIISSLVLTPAGAILATGRFSINRPNSTEAARWTGTAWQPLPFGDHDLCSIRSLAIAANGDVLGSARWYDGEAHYRFFVARWDGQHWQQLGADLPSEPGRLLATASGRLLVTCTSQRISSRTTTIASWDGSRWRLQELGTESFMTNREALAVAANGDLIVRDPVYSLTRWDGQHWHALADKQSAGFPGSHPGRVTALAIAPNRDILLAGLFYPDTPDTLAPHVAHLQVCRWNGRQRQYLGQGLAGDIHTVGTAANGEVLAGGQFVIPGSADSVYHVARWNGQRWQHLGADLPFAVTTLAAAPNGDIVAGGHEGVARWNGHQWQPVPLPFPGAGALNHIQSLAIAPTGDLIVGGSFSPTFGTVEASVLRWDGRTWQVIGRTPFTFVQSLALGSGGQLVVGTGSTSGADGFSQSSGRVVSMPANGSGLQSHSFNNYVQAVAIAPNGDIIAGGSFTHYLVRWNGKSWQPIGTGLNSEVWAVAVASNGDIVVGGDFTATGDASQSLALWGIYRP